MNTETGGGSRSLKTFNSLITSTLLLLALGVAAWVAAWLLGLDILYAVAGVLAIATAIPLFLMYKHLPPEVALPRWLLVLLWLGAIVITVIVIPGLYLELSKMLK